MEVLVINGHDYSRYVSGKGVSWSRNDVDSEKTTRTKDGNMRRYKITTKRKISFKMLDMPRSVMSQLDDDLSAHTFSVKYLDLHGIMTKRFYCSSFSADIAEIQDGTDVWESAAFSIIEV